MVRVNLTILLAVLSTLGYTQEFKTELGTVKYKTNPDNTISYLGLNFHYKHNGLFYQSNTDEKSFEHSLSYSDKLWTLNFSNATAGNTTLLKFKNFSFTEKQSANQKMRTIAYTNKDIQVDYVSAQNPFVTKNYWGSDVTTKSYFSINHKSFSGKFIDNYYTADLKIGPVTLQRARSDIQSENNFRYKDGDLSAHLSDFYGEKLKKHFVEISSKAITIKSVSGTNVNAQMLAFNNITMAHGDSQDYIQAKSGEWSYRLTRDEKKINYGIDYRGLTLNGKQWMYSRKINKNLFTQLESSGKINNASYELNTKGFNLSLKYADSLSVYDFFLNHAAFNVRDNSFDIIQDSEVRRKRSATVAIGNSLYSLKSDIINDLWNFNFRANKELTIGYLKDLKNNHISVSDISRFGNGTLGYNLDKRRIDKLALNFSFKF